MKYTFLLLIAGLIAHTSAEELDLDQIESELEQSPFVQVQSGLEGRPNGLRRPPITGFCECTGDDECGCCAAPAVFKNVFKGCINFQFNSTEKVLSVKLDLLNHDLFVKKISTVKLERVCGHLPGKAKILGFCMNINTTEEEGQGTNSCPNLEIKVKSATAALIKFACINLKDGHLSFSETTGPSSSSVVNVSIKNPLKLVINFIRRLLHRGKKTQ